MPGQQRAPAKQGSNSKIILPSSAQRKAPPIPNGSGNFPELNDIPDGMENAQTISPRNFRPPTGPLQRHRAMILHSRRPRWPAVLAPLPLRTPACMPHQVLAYSRRRGCKLLTRLGTS